jgi:hypothetical protein
MQSVLLGIDEGEILAKTDQEQHPSTGMTMMLTLGAKSVNAMTYRSYVDPQEARPNLDFYDPETKLQRERQKREDMDAPEYKMKSQRAVEAEKQAMLEEENEEPANAQTKYGTWDGVMVSCLLNIFGVIMFLRIGWCVGQAGVIYTIVIISLSTVVTVLTTISMAAVATNGTVKAGGAYYLISRAIGPNIGGAIGVLFSLGMSVATAMYVIGFCEALVSALPIAHALRAIALHSTCPYRTTPYHIHHRSASSWRLDTHSLDLPSMTCVCTGWCC